MRILLPFLLASSLAAQLPITLTGKVLKKAAGTTCVKIATHRVACGGAYLLGATGVDLAKWEGQVVDLKGVLRAADCPTVEVRTIAKAEYGVTFSPFFFGSYRLGERVLLTTRTPALALAPLLVGFKPGFVPLGRFGTYQMDLFSTVWVELDVALLGFVLNMATIPRDASLVGLTVLSQGLYLSVSQSGLDARLLNADCFTIRR